MNLLIKWEKLVPIIIQYFKKNIKDKASLDLLSKLDNSKLNDGK